MPIGIKKLVPNFEYKGKEYTVVEEAPVAVGETRKLHVKLTVVDEEQNFITSTWAIAYNLLKEEEYKNDVIGLFKLDIDNLNIDLQEDE